MPKDMDSILIREKIIKEIGSTLEKVEKADELAKVILSSNKVFVVGAGRTNLMLKAFAKRLGHLGVNVHVVGETIQPSASKRDILIAASGLGKSIFPLSIAKKAQKIGMKIVFITTARESEISKLADLIVYIPASASFQPLGNLFEQSLLLFCDTIAILIQKKKGISTKDLQKHHTNLE